MIQSLCVEASIAPEAALETAFSCATVVHFTPLLNVKQVQDLATSNPQLFKLINIFAYGTIEDLDMEINQAALHKLRQLSLISFATKKRQLPYAELLQRLRLVSVRDLENVVIDAIYNGMVKGHLDSNNSMVLIDDWTARDVPSAENLLPYMSNTINNWLDHASKTQMDALITGEKENKKMFDEMENKRRTESEIQEARQAIEDSMNRSQDTIPLSETTPRTKRRGIMGRSSKK